MKQKYLFYIWVCICLLTGCRKDVYDPQALERDYFIKNIPENFDWSTTQKINLEVIPNDTHSGRYLYTIEIFDKNPLLDKTAALYTTGWCTGQTSFKKSIVIADADTSFFIRQTSPGGRRSIVEAMITGESLICDFNPENNLSQTKTMALASKNKDNIPEEVPEEAIEISGDKDQILKTNQKYVIKGTYSGKLTFAPEGKCDLYITGTWLNPSESTFLENNSNLYILKNGKLLSPIKCKFIFNTYGIIGINADAQLGNKNENNISIQFQTQGLISNKGSLYCNQIKAESPGMEIENEGQFFAETLTTSEVSMNFQNHCYANIQNIHLNNGSSLYIAPDCGLVCKKMEITNSSVKLDNNAMLETGELVPAYWGQNVITGIGNNFSLVRIDELKTSFYNSIIFNGKLYIGCNKYPTDPGTYKVNCYYEDIEKGATIEIESSKCNPEGNGFVPEKPENPEFPQKKTYTKSYTYVSEDNYPSPGDYDMNDLVISMDSTTYYYTKEEDDDNIGKITWHMTLRAVGATRQLGAAIQFDELDPKDIKSVIYSLNMPLDNFKLNSNGTEKGQKHAVIPLFENAHKTLGYKGFDFPIINTINSPAQGVLDMSPVSFDIHIEFESPVDEDDVENDELNYFTIVGTQIPRVEIHLPTYKYTDRSNTPDKLQEVTKKFMWAIKVPGYFQYSHEWISIVKAYPDFEKWVQSDRNNYKKWYKNPDKKSLYK